MRKYTQVYIFLIYPIRFYFTLYLNVPVVMYSNIPFVYSAIVSVVSHSVK